jgi:hypothetical protein
MTSLSILPTTSAAGARGSRRDTETMDLPISGAKDVEGQFAEKAELRFLSNSFRAFFSIVRELGMVSYTHHERCERKL